MKDHLLTVILEPSRDEIKPILDGLTEFGIQAIGGEHPRSIAALLHDASGVVIVGATGQTILGHFHLNQLWVESSLRNQGNGGRILECIVSQAIEQGCSEIRLDRHESQVEIIL